MGIANTAVYTALLAVLLVVLSARVIGVRRSRRISLGDGDDVDLRARIRAHGNFTEYAPMTLLLMAFAELQGGPAWLIHAMGLALLVGRLAHAAAVSPVEQIMPLRVAGMSLTLATLVVGAIANLVLGFGG
ncbi:MAG: MAPEG family protein [Hyphomicrobiaceae bacterium]